VSTGTPASAEPRDSAVVVLVRPAEDGGGGLEVLLVRRHRGAGFMASAWVFPGGVAEPGETDPRVTAARELLEEASVTVSPDDLHYLAHWITPSIEPRRYSARFYAAILPAGQVAVSDQKETVDLAWLRPADALARSAAGELLLPPPQVRTFMDIEAAAARGAEALVQLCGERAAAPHPILPRAAALDDGKLVLLLPWDPDYLARGQGAALALPAGHPLAAGPSRFVFEGTAWKHIDAPGSTSAG
jgi:8-oxo-dGTP pyrophosphatase MutT (NUDIX family)